MNNQFKRVDFDDYADSYEGLLKEQLAFFNKDRGYFSEYKVALTATNLNAPPETILDFGCGIGLSLPYLKQHFPHAKIFATDLSTKSLDYVRKQYAGVLPLLDGEVDGKQFDLIFVSSVFHHVPVEHREDVAKRLAALLSERGEIFIFEHNPFNPVTRHMVATCPFDDDAVLMTLNDMKHLIGGAAGLQLAKSGYCLFFPEAVQSLRSLENMLRWLPLGGQYFVAGRK